jgi:hypothetical protein
MVSTDKIEKHLAGLLVDGSTNGSDPEFQRKRRKLEQLKRGQPIVYHPLIVDLKIVLQNLDRAAEADGFQHIGLDEKGNIIRKKNP